MYNIDRVLKWRNYSSQSVVTVKSYYLRLAMKLFQEFSNCMQAITFNQDEVVPSVIDMMKQYHLPSIRQRKKAFSTML